MDKPSAIYKYENADKYSLLNLKASAIYFNSPANFNDPFDCNFALNIEDISEDELTMFKSPNHSFQRMMAPEVKQQFLNSQNIQIKDSIYNNVRIALGNQMQIIQQTHGIACFSEVNYNLLMWSHYAESCKGFCLEFDTSIEPFNKLKKVNYLSDPPSVSAIKIINSDEAEREAEKLWLTKSVDWHYEKEWRIIHKKAGTQFHYKQKALKAIYFGPLIEPEYLEIICLIIQGQNPHVKFYQGKKSPDLFKMEFAEFTYTSFINKKAIISELL